MLGVILGTLGAISGAVAMLWVYFDSKKHKESIEDSEAESAQLIAIGSASSTLAAAVNVLIQPLNESIRTLQERDAARAKELAEVKEELRLLRAKQGRMTRDLTLIIQYVRKLWKQIEEHGQDPIPPPPELDHVVWDDVLGSG